MPVELDAHGLGDHLVLRRLGKEDLDGLEDLLPQALAGEADPWMDGDACA